METTDEQRLKKLHSTKTQRDKELERIKSLAVVSVLNKNFQETTSPPRPASNLPITLSPSSSLTTEDISQDTTFTKSRSRSISRSQTISYDPIQKSNGSSLYNDHSNAFSRTSSSYRPSRILTSSPSEHGNDDDDDIDGEDDPKRISERELHDCLVTNSPIDTEKEKTLEKRVQELEALCTASMTDLQKLESQSNNQQALLLLQDKLIRQMTDQLEDAQEINNSARQCQICSTDDVEALLKAQQDIVILTTELNQLRPLAAEYNSAIIDLTEKFAVSDQKLKELEQLAQEIQKTSMIQTEFIDTKVQTLLDKIFQKDKIINKLEHDQQQQLLQQFHHQHVPSTLTPDMIHQNSIAQSLSNSSSVIWEKRSDEEQDGNCELDLNSARSSSVSHESQTQQHGKKSYVARWKGNSIPPASPPPSLPLPPIPSAISRSTPTTNDRPRSILSEISGGSSIHAQYTKNIKHLSVDAVGGIGGGGGVEGSLDRRPSSVESEFNQELSDAAYYKEFTDQLQQRLSISKEIDDLRVWEPSDYESIQRKIDSKNWSDSEEDGHSIMSNSQKAAFWKGMKKKLRVQ